MYTRFGPPIVFLISCYALILCGTVDALPRAPYFNDDINKTTTTSEDKTVGNTVVEEEKKTYTVGDSEGYQEASRLLQKSLNLSLDPCDDFFEYACRAWVDSHPIPDDLTSYSQFTATREKVLAEMRKLYEDNTSIPTSKSIALIKQIYNTCMDTEKHNAVGARDLLEKIKTYGYWPMVHNEKWRESTFDLTKLLSNTIQSRDVSVFFDFGPAEDSRNVSRRLLSFDQGSLGLGYSTRDYYLDEKKYEKQMKAYRKYTIGKVRYYTEDAGMAVNESKIESDVDEIIAFEKEWAQILVAEEDRRNYTKLYNVRRFDDLKEYMSIIDWKKLTLSTTPFLVHSYLKTNPSIIISDVEYLQKMNTLLQNTDPRIVTNYILLRWAGSWSQEIGKKYEDLQQEFAFQMYGRKQRQPRWKDCVSSAGGKLSYASGSMYVRKYFDANAKNTTLDMITDLQEAFRNMMHANDWMDAETKKYALEKADQMLKQIGYPDFILNDEKLDDWYKGLEGAPEDSFSQLVEKSIQWRNNFYYRRLLEPVNRFEFISSAAVVNAFYSPTRNAIAFPAGILQQPFFDARFPKALNYGGIGAVIGHEITHGFDDTGRQFDNVGNLRDWWDNTTSSKFNERTQCIIEQYADVKLRGTDLRINGKLTQGENIADNGGIKQAFKAYKSYLEKHGGQEARLPQFESLTNEQLFFVGYAQVWCGAKTPETKTLLLLTDPHSPETARVNTVLTNQPEFAEAFKCPAGSPMNPTKRCVVW
ncbi:Neprilysin-1 [Caenorhabditis elegans]|uniref:Neprilysin-1 n=1 Tax=Caenorhabditis elegans TaxID=6239 RepID=NEPL1_CAEEL|nr:Neprilysin-1 [Caenorhabditis elegans]Q18673.3 RecName: Full=Neprilysin-1 [Caenorhabditis elegans]CAA93782.2 Neprilysin-1 [Caenorhabditis elegans]|eukprot:NP_496490.2 Neprilysin-1 [Caenorhabditis elegans]